MADSDKNRWMNYAIVAAVAALLAAGMYIFSTQFEKVLLSVNKGYSLQAYQNPYLAAEQFLNTRGIETRNAIDISETESQLLPSDALLLLNSRALAEAYHETILDWIEQGGHLIISAPRLWGEDDNISGDTFLDSLGVKIENAFEDEINHMGEAAISQLEELGGDSQQPATDEESSQEANEAQGSKADQCYAYGYARLSPIYYNDNQPPIQIQFSNYAHLQDTSGNALAYQQDYPNNILQYEMGNGMVTVLTSHDMWENHNIGWYDHAFFLWFITQNANRVWFVFDKESDSLLALITRYLSEPLVAGLTLLFFWLWHRAKRFGPVTPEPPKARRSLLEHLTADAKFNWRHRTSGPLLQKQREEINSRYIKRYGNHHDQATLFANLAKISQLTEDQVQWALTTTVPDKEPSYTQLIRCLQRLRNAV